MPGRVENLKIIIIDHNKVSRNIISSIAENMGYNVLSASDSKECISKLEQEKNISIIIFNTDDPKNDVMESLTYVHSNLPDISFIITTSYQDINIAARAMELGAGYYLLKSLDAEHIHSVLSNTLSIFNLKNEIGNLKNKLLRTDIFGDITGESDGIQEVFRSAIRVLDKDVNVLIVGESGTGKELLARALHRGGKRKNGPYITVNCASLTPELADSLLFGHTKGSFTGATNDHTGFFEQANLGTIFLDEIGDMNIETQAKVLRVIEEKKIRKVGGKKEIPIDLRIISATNRDLSSMIKNKQFRNDLYFRLEQYPIEVPALRDRKDDIPILAKYFLKVFCDFHEIELMDIGDSAMEKLLSYQWPGNIRELKNVIGRSAIRNSGNLLSSVFISNNDSAKNTMELIAEENQLIREKKSLPEDIIQPLEIIEEAAIIRAFNFTNQNAEDTAKLLGISRATLYRKLKKYKLLKK